MGPSGRFTHVMIYCTVWDRFIQVLYLGRATRTKKTLPDFREKCRVTRHSQVFRGLTGSQRTPEFWVVTWVLTLCWVSAGGYSSEEFGKKGQTERGLRQSRQSLQS